MEFQVKVDRLKTDAIARTASCTFDVPSDESSGDGSDYDLFHDIRPILIVGRTLCVIPFCGVFGNSVSHLQFRWISLPTITSLVMIILTTINAFYYLWGVTDSESHLESSSIWILKKIRGVLVFLDLAYIFIEFWRKKHDLISLVNKWNSTVAKINFPVKDRMLRKHCAVIAICILVHGVVENLMFDAFIMSSNGNGNSPFEAYYNAQMTHIKSSVPYHPIPVIMYFLYAKILAYSWSFVDVFMISIIRALAFRYKALNDQLLGENSSSDAEKSIRFKADELQVVRIRQDFLKLRHLTDEVNRLLAPLLLTSYSVHLLSISIYVNQPSLYHLYIPAPVMKSIFGNLSICLIFCTKQICWWLTGRAANSPLNSLYVQISCLQFIVRTILVTYFAGEVNYNAQRLLWTLQIYFSDTKSHMLERLERFISSEPTGIQIFGMFLITRRSLISILSFMFSFQIVLLQAVSSTT